MIGGICSRQGIRNFPGEELRVTALDPFVITRFNPVFFALETHRTGAELFNPISLVFEPGETHDQFKSVGVVAFDGRALRLKLEWSRAIGTRCPLT